MVAKSLLISKILNKLLRKLKSNLNLQSNKFKWSNLFPKKIKKILNPYKKR